MLKKYKSSFINVVECTIENSITTMIKFECNNEHRMLWVPTSYFKQFFIDEYKHLGITISNVEDFIKGDDPKYKISNDDVEYYLDKYLYNNVEFKVKPVTETMRSL